MSQQPTHVWPETPTRAGPLLTWRARIESPGGSPEAALWFRVPAERAPWVVESSDAFLLALLFFAMRRGTDLRIHGAVSPSLLRNLDAFQAAWVEWRPDRYRRIEIEADSEREDEPAGDCRPALLAFSGGLDSSFSAWRHTRGATDRDRVRLGAALMVHGFDIPIAEPEVFARAAANSDALARGVGLEFAAVSTNVREILGDWEETHGAALASSLHLLRRGFSSGLIASSHTYGTLRFPWGSNPLTDPLLSTTGFSVSHDGAAFSRREKARTVARWPEAMARLRVCWEGPVKDRNCGACVRCVGTALCFAVEGTPVPTSLPIDDLEKAVLALRARTMSAATVARLSELRDAAGAAGIDEPWSTALGRLVRWQRRALRAAGIRRSVSRWLRGRNGGPGESSRLPEPVSGTPSGPVVPDGDSSRRLYRFIDDEANLHANPATGFGLLLRTTAEPMDEEEVQAFRSRYAIIRRFQQRTLELFRSSLRGDSNPEIADMVVGELPAHLGRDYHLALTEAQDRTPVFFRTDELHNGQLAEIQCCGSGWGIAEQVRALYDRNESLFGAPRHFPETLARRVAVSLREYLAMEPVVHHLADNASRPHGVRYFIGRLREQGVRHFSYDASVTPKDCNFVRSHDFITLPHHNFFAERMERCNRGELFFDLCPSALFDGKVIQAWPFWETTRDWYDDEIRSLFPATSLVTGEGVTLAGGASVSLDEFCRLPPRERQYYLKYAGTDISANWGSKSVYLVSSFTRRRCRELMDSILADRLRGRHWILQEAVRHSEPVAAFDPGGGTLESMAYAKRSGFYGPQGLMAILVMHLRSHKVHGSSDTIVSLVR